MSDLTKWLDEEIYPRLSHELLFGHLDRFKRSGHGYVARCPNPAHEDRHPSFWMPDGKPWGRCFACGHFITWWQVLEQRGLTGQQVIEELARMAGMPPLLSGDPEKARQAADAARQVEEWWQSCRDALWRPEGQDVLDYLRARGYPDDHIRKMDVGVRPGPGGAVPGGLRLPPPEYRLLIPARSRGGIIGFAGRRLDGGEPKYHYGAGLQKSALLWGQHRPRKGQVPVVVEGVLDAESLSASGIDGVVALGGARASGEQVRLLSAFPRVILALDSDQAGWAGMMDLVRVLASGGVKTYVAALRGAKDPDELLRRDGPEVVREAFRQAASGHRWLVRRMAPPPGAGDQERDAALERVLDFAELLSRTDPVAARQAIDEVAVAFGLDEVALAEAVERLSEKRSEQFRREKWEDVLNKAQQAAREGKHYLIPGILRDARDEIAAATETPPEPADPTALEDALTSFPDGLRLPWAVLDTLVRVDRGGVTIIGAATSAGKSTFLYNLLLAWLRNYSDGAFTFWSGEVAAPLIFARLVSILAGVGMGEVMRQHREQLYTREVLQAKQELVQLFSDRTYLLDGPLDADGLAAKVRAAARRREVVAVMVDYLQMLPPPAKPDGSRYANREQEVTATAKALHELAVEVNTSVVAAAQISRNNYQYALRPRLTDLRESGGIEQYATAVFGLWNSTMARGAQAAAAGRVPVAPADGWYWTPQQEDSPDAQQAMTMAATHGQALLEVSVLKSRWRGHVGKSVPLAFNGVSGCISDLPREKGPVDPAAVADDADNKKIKNGRRR